ncbi:MAG TPA: hotdog domain-containing protein, partial [Chloroflexota bacterium]|nr:hotdog domain-containing protein [Chloroflexota bacterium]
GVQAVTARLEVRFLERAGAGDRLTVRAEITRDTRRLAYVEAAVRREARVIALASGTFVKVGPLSADSLHSTGLWR